MKNKLLKRLTTMVVAVAMVATMVMGVSVDVKAAGYECPKGQAEKSKLNCDEHQYHLYVHEEIESDRYLCCEYEGTEYYMTKNLSSDRFSSGNVEIGKWYACNSSFRDCYICPNCGPKGEEVKEEKEEVKDVDHDTFKSEAPYGTAGVTNTNSKIGDLKVHKVNSITETNQKLLADAFAKQYGKKARILTTVSLHPRRELGVDNGKKESLIYSNLEKKPQTVYAVCYNQTDKAYYLTGTLDKDGVATFPDFILRDATNVTIFVLE